MKTQKVKGINKLLVQFSRFGEDGKRMAAAITNVTAEKVVAKAKLLAPVDLGQLRQSIGKTTARKNYNRSFVFANAPYAPYINWGTGGLVDVEPRFTELAITFKGKGLKKININPTGFLTTPFIQETANYRKMLRLSLEKLTKQYNSKK